MNTGIRDQGSGVKAAEETLWLIARLHAPDGLEERLQENLRRAAPRASSWTAWLRPFNGWMQSAAMHAVAATAIVAVVVGGCWIVSSHLPAQSSMAVTAPLREVAPGDFSSAGAKRTPQTLDRPLVTAPVVAPPAKTAPHFKAKTGSKAKGLGAKGLRD